MRGIGRKSAPINVIMHYPETEEGKQELARRVASVHADFTIQYIQNLKCPTEQKIQLLDAVINDVKKELNHEASERSL